MCVVDVCVCLCLFVFVCVVLCCVWVILVVVCVWKEVLSFQARKECVGGCISDVGCGSGGLG